MNIGRHFLKKQQTLERNVLRQSLPVSPKSQASHRTFRHWLKEKDSRKSTLWRHRRKLGTEPNVDQFFFPKSHCYPPDYATYRKKVENEQTQSATPAYSTTMAFWATSRSEKGRISLPCHQRRASREGKKLSRFQQMVWSVSHCHRTFGQQAHIPLLSSRFQVLRQSLRH